MIGLRALHAEVIHRLAVAATLVLVIGLYFDGWWHGTYGRHSFWIPPHLVIYAGVGVMTAALGLRWVLERRAARPLPAGYRVLALAIALTVVAAPLDELWHRRFGAEPNFSLIALWSPPHLLALLSAIVGGLGLLSTIAREEGARRMAWAMIVLLAAIVGFATFALIPFEPTGIYRIAGVGGAYLITLILVGLRLLAAALVRRPGVATGIAALVTPLVLLLTLPTIPPSITTMGRLPWWVLTLAAFAAAGTLDLLISRNPAGADDPKSLARWGALFASVFTVLFYPAANLTTGGGLQAREILAIIGGSALTAYLAGWAAWWTARHLAGRPVTPVGLSVERAKPSS